MPQNIDNKRKSNLKNQKSYTKDKKYIKKNKETKKSQDDNASKWAFNKNASSKKSHKNYHSEKIKKDYPYDKAEKDKQKYSDDKNVRALDMEKYNENLIEGRNPVLEALKSGRSIDILFIQSGQIEGSIKQIIAIARDKNILIKEVDKGKLDRISVTKSHQGVIASAALYKYYDIDDILQIAKDKGEDPFIILLDEITDPQNLGSILRSCDGAGVHGVIIPKRRSASLTPIIGKTSAGAVEHVPVSKVNNISQTIAYLKDRGLWIAGAHMTGDTYYKKDLTGPIALVIGSEGKGLSRLVKESCDYIVSIPMIGKISSLNAAVSGAILLFEIRKQRIQKAEVQSIH